MKQTACSVIVIVHRSTLRYPGSYKTRHNSECHCAVNFTETVKVLEHKIASQGLHGLANIVNLHQWSLDMPIIIAMECLIHS